MAPVLVRQKDNTTFLRRTRASPSSINLSHLTRPLGYSGRGLRGTEVGGGHRTTTSPTPPTCTGAAITAWRWLANGPMTVSDAIFSSQEPISQAALTLLSSVPRATRSG